MNSYVNEISNLPFSTVYAFDDPEDQIDILNNLILSCIETHAPLKRIKLTRPIAPWMRDPAIETCRAKLELFRQQARIDPQLKSLYKERLTEYKKKLKQIKNNFFKKSLSSKDPKAVWNTIHRVLNNQKSRINHHPSEMNEY